MLMVLPRIDVQSRSQSSLGFIMFQGDVRKRHEAEVLHLQSIRLPWYNRVLDRFR